MFFQIRHHGLLSGRRSDRSQKRLWIVPPAAGTSQVAFVQLLEFTDFVVTVETLSDLQPQNLERTSSCSRARPMGADDNHRWARSLHRGRETGSVHGAKLAQ